MSAGSNTSGTAPLQKHTSPSGVHSTAQRSDTEPLVESEQKESLEPLPGWAAEALVRLTLGEKELCRVRECQTREIEEVNQGLERTILGVQTEERLLLERVQQDHRDAQLQLEQLQRENATAARAGQSLVDQRLHQIAQMKKEIEKWTGVHSGSHQNQLLHGISELLQPWEITLSLKRVSFRPSFQPKPISFGNIQVQVHNISIPIGACETPDQQFPLHSDTVQEGDFIRASNRARNGTSPMEVSAPCSMNESVQRETCPSFGNEDKPQEVVQPSPRSRQWPPLQDSLSKESLSHKESSHLLNSDTGDFYQAATLRQKELDAEESGEVTCEDSQKDLRNLVKVYDHKIFIPVKEDGLKYDYNKLTSQEAARQDMLTCSCRTFPFSKERDQELLSSQHCLCLSFKNFPCSCVSVSPDELPLKSSGEMRRSSSPADSLDSCYTFIVSSPRDHSNSSHDRRMSKSTVDLSGRNRPMIDGKEMPLQNPRTTKQRISRPIRKRSAVGRTLSASRHRNGSCGSSSQGTARGQGPIRTSLSMSVMELPFSNAPGEEWMGDRDRRMKERTESASTEEGEAPGLVDMVKLVRQFGKQGSGRSDFALPSGLHATPQGQLFIVDCGNARVQVTDPRGNILQQVSSGGIESSNRRCRNYFDIAVSTKGLIVLSCAAQRVLLVFNRHGRQLQTFGGAGRGGRVELEAPRGVAINFLDEFLVVDVRRGTLTVLKLDPRTGSKLECTTVSSFYRPYLVGACLTTGLVAVSERGNEAGQVPRIKVLGTDYSVIRILGECMDAGPLLSCPWGVCIDKDGDVLVADWGEDHRVVIYPAQGTGYALVPQGLSGPRGLTLLPQGHLVVSDSMHHCIKIFKYKKDCFAPLWLVNIHKAGLCEPFTSIMLEKCSPGRTEVPLMLVISGESSLVVTWADARRHGARKPSYRRDASPSRSAAM
ncbi:hypothetical protein GN956_G4461 [Arapaima gigas]